MNDFNLKKFTIEEVIKMLDDAKNIKSSLLSYIERDYELYELFSIDNKFSHEIDNISETIDTLTLNLESYLWNRKIEMDEKLDNTASKFVKNLIDKNKIGKKSSS
jgi:nucleoid-associated protein YejK